MEILSGACRSGSFVNRSDLLPFREPISRMSSAAVGSGWRFRKPGIGEDLPLRPLERASPISRVLELSCLARGKRVG
jgi:hypothetical protein